MQALQYNYLKWDYLVTPLPISMNHNICCFCGR